MFTSLRSRLLLLLLLIALPAFGLTLNAYLTIYRQGMTRIEQDARDLTQLAAKDQEAVVTEARLLLILLARLDVVRDPQQSAACHELLATLFRQQPGYANFGAADREGNVYCSAVTPGGPINVRDRPWFQGALSTGSFAVSDYQIGRGTGKPGLAFGYPLRGPDGEFQGALFASSDLSWLQRLVATVQLPAGSTATVLDPEGRILARFPDPAPWVGKVLPDAPLAQLVRDKPGTGFTELAGLDGVPRFYAYTPLASTGSGVYLLIGLSQQEALAGLRQTLTWLTVLSLITLAGLALVWYSVSVLLVRPIGQLTGTARQLGDGDFSARCGFEQGARELRGLAVCFNDMAAALEQRDAERQAAAERIHLINASLEQRVAERTAQLQTSNHELEAFSFSVSHDLRAPLRAIGGFTEILAHRHRDHLNAEGQHYLENVILASQRMSRLIDDLLAYSRLGRRALHTQTVALAALVQELVGERAERIRATGAGVGIAADLPDIDSDPTLLRQIFGNLLDNALLYHRADLPPQIAVAWSQNANGITLRVSDQGIGIPAEYHQKIFEMFQRLHSEEDYPGTGIGLALVRKAVTLLNGQVTVESESGQGSAFSVTLPRSPL